MTSQKLNLRNYGIWEGVLKEHDENSLFAKTSAYNVHHRDKLRRISMESSEYDRAKMSLPTLNKMLIFTGRHFSSCFLPSMLINPIISKIETFLDVRF